MSTVSPELYRLAERFLTYEAEGRQGHKELTDAARVVCKKLCQRMGQLVGSYEASLLSQRAIARATDQFPFLDGVDRGSDGCLRGLEEKVEPPSQRKMMEALVSIIANFLGLMSIYIGEQMVVHLLETAWPEAFPGNTESRS